MLVLFSFLSVHLWWKTENKPDGVATVQVAQLLSSLQWLMMKKKNKTKVLLMSRCFNGDH